LVNGGLSPDHRIRDVVHLLDVRGNGYGRIDELLEGGQFVTVEVKANGSYFDQSMHGREEAGGLSVEGEKGPLTEMPLVPLRDSP
jgi:hypothetical protein